MEDDFKKQLLGVGTEIGGGVGTDLATSPLLGLGPAGIAGYVGINAFQGSFTNYQVQKYLNPDEDVNWGEVISSGVEMVPKNMTKVSGDQLKTLLSLLNLLEEHDDIQNIYSNVEFDELDL